MHPFYPPEVQGSKGRSPLKSVKRSRAGFFRAHSLSPPHGSARITPKNGITNEVQLKRIVANMRVKRIPEDVIKLFIEGQREENRLNYFKRSASLRRESQYNDWMRENRLRDKIGWERLTLERFMELRGLRRR